MKPESCAAAIRADMDRIIADAPITASRHIRGIVEGLIDRAHRAERENILMRLGLALREVRGSGK